MKYAFFYKNPGTGKRREKIKHIRTYMLYFFFIFFLVAGNANYLNADGLLFADDDTLSDVQAQVGLAFVMQGKATMGKFVLRGANTGTLSYQGISIYGSSANPSLSFAIGQLGSSNNRITLNVTGNYGGRAAMRLEFPDMFAASQPFTIKADQSFWKGPAGGAVNLGSLTLGDIYHNRSRITLWAPAGNLMPANRLAYGGLRGEIELNAKIGIIDNNPGATSRGFRFTNFSFSRWQGVSPYNDPGTGYASFGIAGAPIEIDVYTVNEVGLPASQYPAPQGTTRMRIRYSTNGTATIQNTGVRNAANSGWSYEYGRVELINWRPAAWIPNDTATSGGHIEITMPISGIPWHD